MRINPESSVSIYLQVADQIKEDIKDRKLKAGDMLPPDHFYCTALGISHMTVKKAIDVLVNEGIVYRKKGVGTFIPEAKIVQSLFALSGFTGDNEKKGNKIESLVLTFSRIAADESVAEYLRIEPGTLVVNLKRIRYMNNIPVALEDSYVNLQGQNAELIFEKDFKKASLYRYLSEECGINLKYAEETIEVSGASSRICEYLEIAQGRPVFLLSRTSFDENNQAIEYVKSIYRADRYIFSAILTNNP